MNEESSRLERCLASAAIAAALGSYGRLRDSLSGKACEPPSSAEGAFVVVEWGLHGLGEALAQRGASVTLYTLDLTSLMRFSAASAASMVSESTFKRALSEAVEVFIERSLKETGIVYPGSPVEGFVWARTSRCPGGDVALVIGDPVLSERARVAVDALEGEARIVKASPGEARKKLTTFKGRLIRCPRGGSVTVDEARKQYRDTLSSWDEGRPGRHPLALIAVKEPSGFREPEEEDLALVRAAEDRLRDEWPMLAAEGLIPVEPMPESPPRQYGVNVVYKLFTARQLLAHAAAAKALRKARDEVESAYGPLAARGVAAAIALAYLKVLEQATAFTPWDPKSGSPGRYRLGSRGYQGPPRLHGEVNVAAALARLASTIEVQVFKGNGIAVLSETPLGGDGTAVIGLGGWRISDVVRDSWASRAYGLGSAPTTPGEVGLKALATLSSRKLVLAYAGDARSLPSLVDSLLDAGWAPRLVGLQPRTWNIVLEASRAAMSPCIESPRLMHALLTESVKRARSKARQGVGPASAAISSVIEALGFSTCWPIASYSGSKLVTVSIAERLVPAAIASAASEALGLDMPPLDPYTSLYVAVALEGPLTRGAAQLAARLLKADYSVAVKCCLEERPGHVSARPLKAVAAPRGSALRLQWFRRELEKALAARV